jgi:hypothetical protein
LSITNRRPDSFVYADLLADFQNQVETDTLPLDLDAGYRIGRTMTEEISPMWFDHDETQEAVIHAKLRLRAYQVRLQVGRLIRSLLYSESAWFR